MNLHEIARGVDGNGVVLGVLSEETYEMALLKVNEY